MDQQSDNSDTSSKAKSSKDRWVKLGFLVAALVAATVVYTMQREDPKLPGWGSNLKAALAQAREDDTKVVVLMTTKPMSHAGRKLVTRSLKMPKAIKVLAHLGFPKVHLDSKRNKAEMAQYDVNRLPTLLLLHSDGEVLKKHEGYMSDINFCNDFLGMAAADVP